MSHTNLDQCRGKNSERGHSRPAEWFDQVHACEKVQRGGYAGVGPFVQGAFSSGGHPRSRTACSVTPGQSPQGKRNNVFFYLPDSWRIYFLKFSLINCFHQNPDVSRAASAVTGSAESEHQSAYPTSAGELTPGPGGCFLHTALDIHGACSHIIMF